MTGELISPETELLENIAKDQGHPDYVDVKDPLLVMDILEEDKESVNVLLNESSETSGELYSLHNNAYNTAYTDEKYNEPKCQAHRRQFQHPKDNKSLPGDHPIESHPDYTGYIKKSDIPCWNCNLE